MNEAIVFVYGTLKRGGTNHGQMIGARLLGPARTQPGHTLYSLGDYPGLVLDPADNDGVIGELWAVSLDQLAQLDAFEGVAEGLYARVQTPLAPPHAAGSIPAWMYLYRGPVTGRTKLGSNWPV